MSINFNVNGTKMYPFTFVNPKGQKFLVATNLLGSDYVKLPKVPKGSTLYVQYRIDIKERTSLPKPDLPCHKDGHHYMMHDCLEEHFQNARNCSLPWRKKSMDRWCHSAEDLRYKDTSMYVQCTHNTYSTCALMIH